MRAMFEIARHYGKGVINRRDITKIQGISHGYLENILISLKTAQLIRPVRGANGGFVLARTPAQITLLEIVKALEGSLAPVECVENPGVCDRSGRCPTRSVWKKLFDAQVKILSGMTLQNLIDDDAKNNAADFVI
jgi:Rrf2 family transcriptional regulator, cysteine metabolism repressor